MKEIEPKKRSPELVSDLVADVEDMVRLQVQLAKQEISEIAVSNAIAAGAFSAAGVLALTAVLVGIPVLLVTVLPWHVQVAAVWIALYLLLAGVGALIGKSMMRLEPPKKTLETLKESREWALRQIKFGKS